MKIGWKLVLLWIISLLIFSSAGAVAFLAPERLNGVHGLTIRFFLGYCGIIVVTQVLAVMAVIRRLAKKLSRDERLRQPEHELS